MSIKKLFGWCFHDWSPWGELLEYKNERYHENFYQMRNCKKCNKAQQRKAGHAARTVKDYNV